MKIKSRKVAVIGVGNVGSHVAFSLVTRGITDELILIDIKEDKVKSEMLDLKDSLANLNSNVTIKIQDYSELKDAEIVVIAAGPLPRFEQTRLDTLDDGIKIIDDIIPFSVQQVLEQYKKDENIEKENAKLLKYIQDNVKFEMNYSKQLAYDFFINKRNETGYYNPRLNVVTIADFDGLKNDEDMMTIKVS